MKKLYYKFTALLLAICTHISCMYAQEASSVPVDPNVRIGRLGNGLTYYIRRNNLPEERADFYIAQKVGSMQEEEEQRGLAHFLEHMAFNGTENFPGDGVKQYLETIGVKFGENLNAYTSFDETVYNITNVPANQEGAVDSCLLILHDWAGALSLDGEEIDKERGVIHEEWRNRDNATLRMYDKILPVIYQGDRYAHRMPIGLMDVVLNFPHQVLRDYYHRWYRPDLQGIIVVGDIDVDEVEQKVINLFSYFANPENEAERVYYPVTDNKEPIVAMATDPEATRTQIYIFNKHEAVPPAERGSMQYLVYDYARYMMSSMLNARFREIIQTGNAPFVSAYLYDGEFFMSKTKDAFTGLIGSKEGEIREALAAYLREVYRVDRHGFTESEYVRARAAFLREVESQYNERNNRKNGEYIREYVNHFLWNEPIPSEEEYYNLMNEIAPNVPLSVINGILGDLITQENLIITVMGPDKEAVAYPTEKELLEIIACVEQEDIEAYIDHVSDEPLMSELPRPGKIVSEEEGIYGTTVLKLSNGATVVLKPTDFKQDEIILKGISFGGTSLMPTEDIVTIINLNSLLQLGGVANFSRTDLEKLLAGKKADISLNVSNAQETVNGSCSPQDIETMLQLLYLNFTDLRYDEDAYNSYKSRLRASLENQAANPMSAFVDTLYMTLMDHHLRALRMQVDMIDKIDYAKGLELGRERYKDAGDFTFLFVGTINMEEIKSLIEQYIASLPALNREETFRDNKMYPPKGEVEKRFYRRQENPKATIVSVYTGEVEYTNLNRTKMSILSQILTLIYTEEVREKEGGTYGVSVSGSVDKYPKEDFTLQIFFETDPGKIDKLIDIVYKELNQIATNGPAETDLNKVKEFMLRKYTEQLKENGYWLGALNEYYTTGLDVDDKYQERVESITSEDIREFAGFLLSQDNRVEVIMISEENKEE
ncbi:MAG: insulinase family protein [Bacteroides sp.]|nr:insulinase family protein [Bacteroides sp.]